LRRIKNEIQEKIINLLGFSSRMGALIYGKEKLISYLYTQNTFYMLFLASDSSENTKKFWEDKSKSLDAELYFFENLTKLELAKRLGKVELSVVATDNTEILKGIRKILKENSCLDISDR
jgi:ribosomal protein L7Ae-like RNA K-turn-binding protein